MASRMLVLFAMITVVPITTRGDIRMRRDPDDAEDVSSVLTRAHLNQVDIETKILVEQDIRTIDELRQLDDEDLSEVLDLMKRRGVHVGDRSRIKQLAAASWPRNFSFVMKKKSPVPGSDTKSAQGSPESQKRAGEGCGVLQIIGSVACALWLLLGLFHVCEGFFVPSLEEYGDRLGLSEGAQGATLLAVGSSSPEFFTAVIGAFFFASEDPGPSTNIGSAVFNQVVIVGCSALALPQPHKLGVGQVARDGVFYAAGAVLLWTFYDVTSPGLIEFWEALTLCSLWIAYITFVIKYDPGAAARQHPDKRRSISPHEEGAEEQVAEPIVSGTTAVCGVKSFLTAFLYVAALPFEFAFKYSVPDPKATNPYIKTIFIMSIIWLGVLTFALVEVVEGLAHCEHIPIDVIGVTVLAVGTSAPDCMGSILVARKGKIDMAVANAFGSNVFDLCFCVGVPFLLQCILTGKPVVIDTHGMPLLMTCLFSALGLYAFLLAFSRMELRQWHGLLFLLAYIAFLVSYVIERQ